jgi:hypothetical protein
MPRLVDGGRFVAGFQPYGAQQSRAVLVDLKSGTVRTLDEDGTGPVWCGSEILVRPQADAPMLRRYGLDGTQLGTIPLPAPANSTEADDEGQWAVYTGPPYGPAVMGGSLRDGTTWGPVPGYTSPAPTVLGVLAARHQDAVLVNVTDGRVLDDRPHRLVRPTRGPHWAYATAYVALIYVDAKWRLTTDGHVYPELGEAYHVAARAGFAVLAREPGQLVMFDLRDPLRGWIVAAGDVQYPDMTLLDETTAEVVWCDKHGVLGHAQIDLLAPPVDLRVDVPPPPVEVWAPTTDVVDLWPLWIGSSGSQWPRRNPADPGIYMDCQAVDLGADRAVATFVKTPDGHVWERRATWRAADGTLWIGLIEDHERDGRIYHFKDGRLMRRFARVGDVWERRTEIREWNRGQNAWGPWGAFRFRVRVASVERSSFGRLRAVIEVDTYQDLEVFELYSNKGWTSWEWWRGSAYATAARKREQPIPVGFFQRTEWPERFDGPRAWPDAPKTVWPAAAQDEPVPSPVPTRITIVEPTTWPVTVPAGGSLRVVYAVTQGAEPDRVRWRLDDQVVAVNAGWDHDHTYYNLQPGTHRVSVEALGPRGEVLDVTQRTRIVEVTP